MILHTVFKMFVDFYKWTFSQCGIYMVIVQCRHNRAPPMPARSYVEENGLAVMLATRRSVGVAPEVNLREYVTHMPLPSMNKAVHSGFKTQMRCHQKYKTGLSEAQQKDLCPPKIKKKVLSWSEYNPQIPVITTPGSGNQSNRCTDR